MTCAINLSLKHGTNSTMGSSNNWLNQKALKWDFLLYTNCFPEE